MRVKQSLPKIFFILSVTFALVAPFGGLAQEENQIDTIGTLPYPFEDQPAFGEVSHDSSKLYLNNPSNIKYEIEYDPVTGQYVFYEKIGSLNYRLPQSMPLEDYIKYDFDKSVRDYWLTRTQQESLDDRGGLIPKITLGGEAFNRIFGGNTINIVPQGYVEVSFGYQVNKTDNPSISENLRKVPTFDFDEKIQMNVTGQIGTKMNMKVNYNTEATFDYENQIKMEYSGEEDEILRSIQAGNVSMPLNGTLITGASNLFGIKAEMQFGKLNFTAMVAQQKGETTTVETEGGAEVSSFEIDAVDYDANKHFFLSQYFRDKYESWCKNTAVLRSNVTISKIEVWVTNKSGDYTDSRNVLAFQDLGEHDPHIYNSWSEFQDNGGLKYPRNEANGLYDAFSNNYSTCRTVSNITKTMSQFGDAFSGGIDFEKVEQARLLDESEYTVNENLGYISLNSALNADEVLAVAFSYTIGGQSYKVGEFSTDGIDAPKTLYVKLLKGTNLSPGKPTWDLMMKNVYSLNAYSLSDDDFELNVKYQNDSTGSYVKYLPGGSLKGHILLRTMRLDMLNSNLDSKPDGVFDYVEDVTVNSQTGRIFFPVLEPFGSHLADSLQTDAEIEKYCFQSLYDSTKTYAKQDAEHSKFVLTGSYKGSSTSDISLGTFNVAQGSVTVTAGGQVLTENIDYTVDYTMGTVKIINEALLASGTTIEVSTESEELFSTESKTLLGGHANYEFSDKLNVGGTLLWMHERPLTEKVDYGDDPISNVMLGADVSYNTESGFLTRALNALPFYSTTAQSAFSFEGEYAQLLPGTSGEVNGSVYIDDFESTKTSIDLRTLKSWAIASTPQHQSNLFPEGNLTDEIDYGVNRAKLAFYNIDPLFLRNNSLTPNHIKNDPEMQSNHYVRQVYEEEIFPNREYDTGESTLISVLNLAYYPEERGQYNFDDGTSNYAAGINEDGTLKSPDSRWGGIMREMNTTDFESANIEYIEFWVMDPFIYDTLGDATGGDLYFNLGEISEDVLKDSRKSFESGLPTDEDLDDVDTTIWGRVSTLQSVTNTFSNSSSAREYQDVGFDGLTDEDEQSFYSSYLENLRMKVNDAAYEEAEEDPSSDDFHYPRGSDYDDDKLDILSRYKLYNGTDGNSPTSGMSTESYTTSGTTIPDIEDINDDNTLNEYERYYQYKVSIRPEDMVVGENYINDIVTGQSVKLKNGQVEQVKWYQFKIPIKSPDKTVGNISDFSSIRFMRMFMRNFEEPIVLRLATLDLVRATWREYTGDLAEDGSAVSAAEAELSAVSIEENGKRDPVNYVLPPGVSRVIDPASTSLAQLDEQSLTLKVNDLGQGDSRAAYKPVNMDFRRYKTMEMFVHAEALEGYDLDDDELKFFIRLGADYTNNYYEYELPLKVTPAGDYSNSSSSDREIVWPEDNQIDLALEKLTDLKIERNAKIRSDSASLSDIYEIEDSDIEENTIKIKGNPNLGDVEVFMIGVHNPKTQVNTGVKSVEVWANELRLSDIDNEGGWAANMRASASLGDLGSVSVALSKQTAGFGSISSGINDRSMDDVTEVNVAASIDWGRFFPDKAGIKIPMYYNYYKSVTNPEYNPLNPDIEMDEALAQLDTKAERDSLKSLAQTVEEHKTISFTNVKVEPQKQKEKSHVWDPENFSVSYTYNENTEHDANTSSDIEKTHQLMFSYNYTSKPKIVEPFKKVKFLQKGPLKLIGDFNFYPLPSQISYRSNFYRYYNETQTRNVSDASVTIPATYEKEFYWKRYLDIAYDLTRSLKFDFSSSNTSTIDEPEGRIDKDDDDYEVKKDSIISNILSGGRPTLYSHTFNATYRLPLRTFKALNFMSATLRYSGTYEWDAGSQTDDETINVGNSIYNSNSITATGNANFQTLFNKVPYFKKVNQKFRRTGRRNSSRSSSSSKSYQPLKKNAAQTYSSKLNMKAGETETIKHKLSTKIVKVLATDKDGHKVSGKVSVVDANTIEFTPGQDVDKGILTVTGKKGDQPFLKDALDLTTRMIIGFRTFSVNYSKKGSTYLPGYLPEPTFFGGGKYSGDATWSGTSPSQSNYAPGLPFMFGWQERDFAAKAAKKGWITIDTTQNNAYAMSENERYTLRAVWEPLPDLKINLNATRSKSKTISEQYLYSESIGDFTANNFTESGSFSMTTLTLGTAFFKIGKGDVANSAAFEKMKTNRKIIAQRLANERASLSPSYDASTPHSEDSEYPDGYGANSIEVLVPAFLSAYQDKDPNSVSLGLFPSLKYLRPNWTVNYEGMVSRIPGLNKVMKSLTFEHSYRSIFSIGSYSTDEDYISSAEGLSSTRDLSDDFVSYYDISSVSITEAFSPLIGMDITWYSDLSTSFEINRTRNLNLSLSNNQLTEVCGNEYTVGIGYRFSHMDLIIKTKKSQKSFSNDLNLRFDLSYAKNKTVLRQLNEDDDQITAGQGIFTLESYADYRLSDKFEMRVYFDKTINNPYTSTTYRTANSEFGVSFKFTLAQ